MVVFDVIMKRNILGVKIDSISFTEAMLKIDGLVAGGKPAQIVTVNPEIVMAAQKDRDFRRIINQADLVVPDGKGIMLAAQFLGKPLRERITGVDLTWAICKLAENRGYRVFFLGGKEGIAKKTAQRIKKLHPNLNIAGLYAGRPDDSRTIAMIKRAKPDILFVAFGALKQEKFISNLKFQISNSKSISIGVGGTFDYIVGVYPYAPEWLRKLGLEWLFRLFTQPWRWNRIITATIRFPWTVFLSKF